MIGYNYIENRSQFPVKRYPNFGKSPKNPLMSLGARLKTIQKDRFKMTKESFCTLLGVSVNTYYAYLSDSSVAKTESIQAILKRDPELNARWLLLGEGEMISGEKHAEEKVENTVEMIPGTKLTIALLERDVSHYKKIAEEKERLIQYLQNN